MLIKKGTGSSSCERGAGRRRFYRMRPYRLVGAALACAGLLTLTACFDIADEVHARGKDPVSAEAMTVNVNGEEIAVARVSGKMITMAMVVDMMNRVVSRTSAAETAEEVEALKEAALQQLITNELAYQQARAQGITIDAAMIDMAIKNLKDNLGGEDKYHRFLEQEERITEGDLRDRVERSLALERIFASEVYAKVAVPEDQVRALYEKDKDSYVTAERITVTDVMFLRGMSDADTMKKAEEVLNGIREDKNLDPWKLVQDGSFIVRNLHLDNEKQKELYEAAKVLKPGELSGVVMNNDALHIIKMKEYVPPRQMTFDEIRAQLENQLRVPAQDRRMEEWEKELRTGAKIEIIELQPAVGAEDNKISFLKH